MSDSRQSRRVVASAVIAIPDLARLKIEPLREAWRRTFDDEPPAFRSRDLLLRAFVYRLDCAREGGLKPVVKRRLTELSDRFAADDAFEPTSRVVATVGSALVREWNGVRHIVLVTNQGFQYLDETYSSLTVVAKIISGKHQSGPRFFGLVGAKIDAGRAEP